MAPQFFQTILKERLQLTENVYEFHFEPTDPKEVSFRAGQFVNIRVDDGKEKIFFRSYSIMNPPSEKNIIKSCIKIIPDGRCTKWLSEIKIGTPVTMMGPIGMFKINPSSKKNILFVATGTGITPLFSMIHDELEKDNSLPMNLLWGFRYKKDIFYENIFWELEKKYSNFKMTIILSQLENGWEGNTGRVTEYLEKNFPDPANTQIYICGVGGMVLDVKNLSIQKEVPAADVHFERYD